MSTSSRSKDAQGVEAYFTDVEHLQKRFREALSAETLSRRIWIIHGVGGIGKSSLLRMFRLQCKKQSIPVGLASGDQVKSPVDVLADWGEDLQTERVSLPTYSKVDERYRAIQAKVDQEAGRDAATKIGKAAAKTVAETAGSMIPGVGPIAGKLAGVGAEALVDWLRTFLTKPDIELVLDPTEVMTDASLSDIGDISKDRRVVLMLDTYEQMAGLDDWARNVAQRLPANVLLVIAGRAVPEWNRRWPGWLAQAEVEELKPMTEPVMRELVVNYYAAVRGGVPPAQQVDSIVQFARGLPLVVTTAVQLWVEYGVEDFETVKSQVVADLVERLKEGVPEELVPTLEAAAAVRWFNQPILRAVLDQADVSRAYNELRRFPFVRPRAEGLALHDVVREMIDADLRVSDNDCHRVLHERAAIYFEARLTETGSQRPVFALERLYHRVQVDEISGIELFQQMAEGLRVHRLANQLRALVNDVGNYPLELENSHLWHKYYVARLMQLDIRLAEAAELYEAVGTSSAAEPKLRAYAFCDLAHLCTRADVETRPMDLGKAMKLAEESLSLAPLDAKLVTNYRTFSRIYRRQGNWDGAEASLLKLQEFARSTRDVYAYAISCGLLRDFYFHRGYWRKGLNQQEAGLQTLPKGSNSGIRFQLLGAGQTSLLWAGLNKDVLAHVQESKPVLQRAGGVEVIHIRTEGLALGLQERYVDSAKVFATLLDLTQLPPIWSAVVLGRKGLVVLREGNFLEAEHFLKQALRIKQEQQDILGIPEAMCWLGVLYETRCRLNSDKKHECGMAERQYHDVLALKVGLLYFEALALTGLVRLNWALGRHALLPSLLVRAEALSKECEYNDHLASLRLTQGHVAWEGHVPESGIGFDAALGYYRQALIYALRYNRFLLDEVLAGRPQGTPLRPIIPHCLERGEDGRRMLVALRDWWQTGINDIGTPRPDTISPIPEGISLLEGERVAREREPGDASPQTSVVDRIDKALRESVASE